MVKLTKAEIRAYAAEINAAHFPFFCARTGELAESLRDVVRTSVWDLLHHGFLHSWKITRLWQ